jgi:hypothetical protein
VQPIELATWGFLMVELGGTSALASVNFFCACAVTGVAMAKTNAVAAMTCFIVVTG